MSKWNEMILVVDREKLFNGKKNSFYGFLPKEDEKVKNILSTFVNWQVKRRGDMEEDHSYKQLIGYVLVKDKKTKDVLVYQRLIGGGEERLHGKASVGIGGHMNEVENEDIYEMLIANTARELEEEIGLDFSYAKENIKFAGLINDDKEEVGKVHLGVVYVCEADKEKVKVMESDTLEIKWLTPERAKQLTNYESWSDFLKPIM